MNPSRQTMARAGLAPWLALGAVIAGCGKTAPEPIAGSGGASQAAGATSASSVTASPSGHLPRDDAGRLTPRSAPPPADPGAVALTPSREPDWDLDGDDSARDYAKRYAVGTKRYGDSLDCVELGASQPGEGPGRRRVEVKTAARCPGAGTIRDVFVVDVGADRLSLDERAKHNPLERWPDGSDPEGPANRPRSIDDMRQWQGPLKQAFRDLLLVPIRVQTYGRGTYPVITIAGWHGVIAPATPAAALHDVAERFCKANGNMPLAIFGGLDRSTILRIRCPAGARWDKL